MIDEAAADIREMQTHSSTVVAIKAARAITSLTEREAATVEEYIRDLERNSNTLRRANPSHATLHTTQRSIVDTVVTGDPETVEKAKQLTSEAVQSVIDQLETAKRNAAENGADWLEDGLTILTHDYSSTVLQALELAARDGAHLTVYITEARPRYLGRKTARVLGEIDRIEPHLLVDSACGHVLSECDRVVFGMDCIVSETLYNRVGTFPISATAAQLDVPTGVIGSGAKIIENGFVFENEFRPASEVMREPAEGFEIENPAYDATPMELIGEVITD